MRNSAQLSSEICENENPKKYRKVEGILTRVAAAKEVCNLIITQANTPFQFLDHLILSSLPCQEKFECYKRSFPENDLNVCVKLFSMLDKDKVKTELTVLYQRQEFRNISDAVKLLQFLLSENLQASFSEVVKLLRIAITIPMTTSEPERDLLLNVRHHSVRSYIASHLRKSKNLEVHEEVYCISEDGSRANRREDIVALNRQTKKAVILDPNVWFEKDVSQALAADQEKQVVYRPYVPHLSERYNAIDYTWEMRGLLFGARG
ncbi:hypothetical protein ANN_26144 [Periplaneta americana]|uniref:Uncharacterized protein n=1 Tax=Periplaneta americana TaxID=6978 RepID=A0ABQ8S5H2_PERAM|nr:hypothetical protein ANN_26144 [Periplaneta americana]